MSSLFVHIEVRKKIYTEKLEENQMKASSCLLDVLNGSRKSWRGVFIGYFFFPLSTNTTEPRCSQVRVFFSSYYSALS